MMSNELNNLFFDHLNLKECGNVATAFGPMELEVLGLMIIIFIKIPSLKTVEVRSGGYLMLYNSFKKTELVCATTQSAVSTSQT